MFQLVSLMLSSGDFVVVVTSVIMGALGYKWVLLMHNVTVMYNIYLLGFLSCKCLHSFG